MAEKREYKEPTIIRTEVIVVDNTTKNQYGDLIVTDKGGGEHKVGNKRSQLYDAFVVGRAVELGYASYMNREYIYTARLVDKATRPSEPRVIEQEEPIQRFESSPATGMITKEIGDHIRAGTLVKIFGPKIALNLVTWYRSQTLGITKIDFDGKDLPQYGKAKTTEPTKEKKEKIEHLPKSELAEESLLF